MIKKAVFLCIFSVLAAFAAFAPASYAESTIDKTYKQNQASYTSYHDCIRLYKLPFGKLYFLALSAANSLNYEIKEMQSRNGYMIIEAEGREFLLDVAAKNKTYTYLKLAPCDNNYYFNPQIPRKIFNYVDLHFNTEVKELKF